MKNRFTIGQFNQGVSQSLGWSIDRSINQSINQSVSQVKSSQVKSSQVKSGLVKSSQVKSSQVKSSQVKSVSQSVRPEGRHSVNQRIHHISSISRRRSMIITWIISCVSNLVVSLLSSVVTLFSPEVMTNAKWVQRWFQVANMIRRANVGANCPPALSAMLKALSQTTMAAAAGRYFRTHFSQWSSEHFLSFKFEMLLFCMLFFNLVETHGTWNGLICVLLHTKVARTGTVLVVKQPGIIIRTAVGTLLPNTLLGKQVAKGICGTKLNLIFLMISSLRFWDCIKCRDHTFRFKQCFRSWCLHPRNGAVILGAM